ncbi:MAG: glycerol-3-phosphate dehydrogenase/oxidase [Candidatus Omnitrophica bacterium]|nr:glycerol-3-phosphate dehydrogenase/oxidase [Candidatus Omnitrophota bacterium]
MISPREALLARLRARMFDVLVIGGGIVGAGIARDAAMRGLSVALVEQGDFGGGTSSKTSKLIHGGLRYLEHGHLRLVFESLRERGILRAIAPGVVHPLSLLLPIYAGDRRPVWKIRAGLWLYDRLAWGWNIRPHSLLSARRAAALEPGLRLDGLRAAGLYADCQMDDARLCLANVLQALSLGAACANYVRVRALLKTGQRVCGGAVEDLLTGRAFDVQARAVVNAAGPWADAVRHLSVAGAPARLAPTKGIHLVLPRLARQALFVQGHTDARMLFILPWGDHSLVGTTEGPVRGPLDALAADAEEVGYLLDGVNRVLPGLHLDADDVIATFAGARPLLAFTGAATGASREHAIEVDRWGLVSVMGGKFTTYRRMAQEAVDLLVARLRVKADRCLTDQVSLLEAMGAASPALWQELTRAVDPEALSRLLVRYGVGALSILRLIDREPSLAQPLCPHHDYLEAELAHAITQEFACTVTDVLARRTRIAWSSCQGLDALSTVTGLFQRYAGAAGAPVEHQVEAYRQFLARGLAFRSSSVPAPAAVA